MNVAAEQLINSDIYVEHDYQGNLSEDELTQVNSIDWEGWFQTWLEQLSKNTELTQNCELSLRLTSDSQIQSYNYKYRGFDKPTDVLAFAATEADIPQPNELVEPLYLGDIIISLDTAVRQAKEQKHPLRVELAWLSSHGLLHLIGWDHPDEETLQEMLSQQSQLIHFLNAFNTN